MARGRTGGWLGWLLGGVGLLLVFIPGLWVFMSVTATRLHPTPTGVPSAIQSGPLPRWASAVEQGRGLVRAHLSERNLPGVSVAVGAGSEIVWAEGFGFADVEKRSPVTPNHRFRIGTASAMLTSAAVGRLLEEDRLKLDDPIQTYVPTFPQKPWPVTLRRLMGHVAGFRNDGGDEGPLFGAHCEQPVEALRHFADAPLLFEPGTRFRYSSYGWIVVSAAVEAAGHEPFLTFMQDEIFGPLGMRDTAADSLRQPVPDRVTPYFPRFAADPRYGLQPMRDLDLSCYAGSGVFLSTPSDLVRFGMAVNSGKLLKPATVRLLQTPLRPASGDETGYGLGWDQRTVSLAGEPARYAGQDGKLLGGAVASLATFPEHGMAVAVVSNMSYADPSSLATQIAETFARSARVR